jgi:hypothetical protein
MTVRKIYHYVSKNKANILPWFILLTIIAGLEIRRKGFLVAYLDASGYVTFGVTILLSYLICSHLLKIQHNLVVKSYEKSIKTTASRLITITDNSFFRTLVALGIFFAAYSLVLSANQEMLLVFSGQPYHVLFPCSESLVMTDEMKKQAMDFYGKKFFHDFECDYYQQSEDKW